MYRGRRGDFRLPHPLVAARRCPSPPAAKPVAKAGATTSRPLHARRHPSPPSPPRPTPRLATRPSPPGARARACPRARACALLPLRVLYCRFACEASSQPRRATRTVHSLGLTSPHGHPPLSPLPPLRGAGERTRACRTLSVASLCPWLCARSPCSSSCVLVEPLGAQTICASDTLRAKHCANLLSVRGGGKCTVKPHTADNAPRFIYLY